MSLIISLDQIQEKDREQVGGKAFSVAILSQTGMSVTVDGFLGIVIIG